ncbi:SDR family NAD(P)-dependent oxidoreductase [Williamsia soli]|uniref:SDR family NAD(P)-dependent oxidoreductase n=1 Tax=Williamsia soli TaxID=364929 RepID=UPI001A9ECBC1|nr:SDR family NAD(P)-dependent oxidoreductase [Williamsia soli]
MTSSQLAGKTALVTGAGAGIGAAIARNLSAQGAKVVVVDRDGAAAKSVADTLTDAEVCEVDLGDPDQITARLSGLDEIDILVNNAGLTRVERFTESEPATWDAMWQVNLRAPMLLSQLVVPHMIERGWGRIVFVSTDSARAGGGGECAYSATKAGLLGFAKSLARETAKRGVTSNAICPGLIETAMLQDVASGNPDFMEKLRGGIPMRRLGTADEVASAVDYLCSPLSSYTTGQILSVNGGIVMP